jgi:hypothetical protein
MDALGIFREGITMMRMVRRLLGIFKSDRGTPGTNGKALRRLQVACTRDIITHEKRSSGDIKVRR